LYGIRSPLPVDDGVVILDVEAEDIGALAELFETSLGLIDSLDPIMSLGVPTLQRVLER